MSNRLESTDHGKLQYRLSLTLSEIRNDRFPALIDDADDSTKCRIHSCSNPESGAFLTVYPRNDFLLTNDGVRVLLYLRLGLP